MLLHFTFQVHLWDIRWNNDPAHVPDFICQDLAEDISKDWKMLGEWLSISRALLDNIHLENISLREKSIAMLNKWRQMSGEEAKVDVLTEALKQIGRKDLCKKLRGMNISSLVYSLNPSTVSGKQHCCRLNWNSGGNEFKWILVFLTKNSVYFFHIEYYYYYCHYWNLCLIYGTWYNYIEFFGGGCATRIYSWSNSFLGLR